MTAVSARTPQKDRISAFVSNILSDIAVAMEIDEQVAWHQPNVGFVHSVPGEELDAQFDRHTAPLFFFQDELQKLLPKMTEAGLPLVKFDYPSEKRRTATTTEKMRNAEANLDEFWRIVDSYFQRPSKFGKSIQEKLIGVPSHRILERTPEWIEPTITAKDEVVAPVDAAANELSVLDLEERTRPVQETEPSPIKIKVKTRGNITEPTAADEAEEESIEIVKSTLPVSKRAIKVFSILFHDPAAQSIPPGELPWTDFLHALSSTGFSVEKQNGSAWLFVPPSNISQRPIIFHEPHPSSKIPIHIARRHGRRLARAYGWTSNTFVLAS